MKYLIFSLSVVLLTTSCGYNCEGYDLEYTEVLAFRLGDTIQYQSDNLDTIILVVEDFFATEPTHFKGLVMCFECYEEAYYTTTKDEIYGISIKEIDLLGSSYKEDIIFCDNDIYEMKSEQKTYEVKSLDSLIIDNTTYKHVREVKDLSGERRISGFLKAPHCGIIRFYDSETKLTWTQIHNKK